MIARYYPMSKKRRKNEVAGAVTVCKTVDGENLKKCSRSWATKTPLIMASKKIRQERGCWNSDA